MRIEELLSWDEVIDRGARFLKSIKASDSIMLLYHGDADGCTSGIFLYNIIKKLTGKYPENVLWVSTKSYDLKNERALIRNIKPDILIITDLDIITDLSLIAEWSIALKKILIYDHHTVNMSSRIIPDNLIYLNARLLNQPGVWHPASYFGYSLSKRFLDTDYSWVAAIGLRGDHALNEYPELIEDVKKIYPHLFDSVDGAEYKTYLEGIVFLINAGFFYNPDLRNNISFKLLQMAYENNNPFLFFDKSNSDVMSLIQMHEEIVSFVDEVIDKVKSDVEETKTIFYSLEVNTPHYIVGIIAGSLSKIYPDKIFAVGSNYQPEMGIEIRMGDNVNLNLVEVINKMRDSFEFISAGGHPRAAGCLIKTEKFQEFSELFSTKINEVRE